MFAHTFLMDVHVESMAYKLRGDCKRAGRLKNWERFPAAGPKWANSLDDLQIASSMQAAGRLSQSRAPGFRLTRNFARALPGAALCRTRQAIENSAVIDHGGLANFNLRKM
jgi:hypothetical protein